MQEFLKHVEFVPSGRGKARCAADPKYPEGMMVDLSRPNELHCQVEVPYPAPECGYWKIGCAYCGMSVAVTAVGRADDPRFVKLRCLKVGRKKVTEEA